MSARTSVASGTPISTTKLRMRLWVWSKNSIGRPGNGVSVQAKLKSPKPTPNQGCDAISASVFDQMPKRELDDVAAAAEARLAAERPDGCASPRRDVPHHIAA